ncbi:MAG: S9 family peptidase [Synergistaceae bacterium]|nr:S9 family peptidase [Synergistaceae bacterium]
MKRHVERQDFLKFCFPSNPCFSPDGGRIAYRVSRPDRDRNGYDSDLWVYDLDGGTNRRMTASGREGCFCWTPDGTSLVFASERNGAAGPEKNGKKEKDARTVFYSIATAGGEAVRLFEVPRAAKSVKMLDDRRYLLTVVCGPDQEKQNPEDADLLVFNQIPFLANGRGFVGQQRTALALYDAKTREFRRLTPPSMEVSRCTLNRSRTEALIVGVEYTDVKPLGSAVYKMDLFTGALRRLCGEPDKNEDAFTFSHAAWWGDVILLSGTNRRKAGVNENLKFYVLVDGQPECLTPELDTSLSGSVVADSHYGCADLAGAFFPYEAPVPENSPGPVPTGVIYCSTNVMKSRLFELDRNGRSFQITFDTSAVVDYCVWENGRRAAFVAYEGLCPTELYLWEDGLERRLTSFNRPLFDELRLSQPIHVSVDNGQGCKLDGWYMRPADFQEGRKYPAILHIHGGPKAAFGDIYHHEMQCWAAQGYAVLYCNPRGGDGRGNDFSDIRGHYGDLDFHDLMAFTDWCADNLRFIDASRLGVTGGSYGGYMVNWIVTHTDRFKAAVSQRGISNWVSKFGSSDIGYYFVEDQHGGTPWKNPENPWNRSPLKYAANAKTPTLFIHSEEDYRCELGQGFQMFTALKALGVESRLCLFKGENHELSRSGKPRSRLARLREISAWFDSHL